MGVCPQHDVLYEELTAREHLNLYARFKVSACAVLFLVFIAAADIYMPVVALMSHATPANAPSLCLTRRA
jgi:hypothetical protein